MCIILDINKLTNWKDNDSGQKHINVIFAFKLFLLFEYFKSIYMSSSTFFEEKTVIWNFICCWI